VPKTSLALLLCAAGACAAGQPWSPDDLWNRHTPSDPRISPDGQQVVYLDNWNDRDTNSACSNLWLVSTRDRQSRRLTEGPWRDQSPRWSADGKRIAWISGRGGIHVLELQSRQELSIETGSPPLRLAWSADGKWFAFSATLVEHADPAAWAPLAVLRSLWPPPPGRTALFLVPSSGGAALEIPGIDLDAAGEPAWMPDGKSILVAAADGEIYSIRLADHVARPVTHDTGRNENPLPSPDGSKIAWMATDSHPHSYSIRKLYVMNADGSRVKTLAPALDRDPAHPQWSSDSRTIYFIADDSGSTHVFASRADSTLRQVTKAVERLSGFSLADNGHAVAVRSTGRSVEVVSFAVDLPSTPVVLAAPMEKLLAGHGTGAVEEIRFPSAGKSIQGWIVTPPQFDPSKKYPLLLDIADAPRRMYGPEFSLGAQICAARGWVVLRVNPRGTPGYGEEFGRLLATRYPGDDAEDLLAAVDVVVAKGYVDAKRLAVSGGLLTAWIIGHSDRFAAAVARRPIVDLALYGATSAMGARQVLSWMGVMPWEDPEQYVRHSPIYFAQSWKTPTLILASASDPQSDEFYSTLQQRQVNAAMVRIPDADKPAGRVLEWETMLAWLQQFGRP
jgi:dipeptidyl aminopeptidase/acylaminoacyl peptidase